MNEILLDLSKIQNLIPHRAPMLLLDEVKILTPSEASGTYLVRGDEYFLQGHYPGNPIVPGNIQSEMLAQLGAVLISHGSAVESHPYHNLRKGKTPVLVGLNNVRFKSPAKPGSTLELHITITKDAGLIATAEASITVNGSITVTEEMTVAFI